VPHVVQVNLWKVGRASESLESAGGRGGMREGLPSSGRNSTP
jgi:hypothetical protein